MLAADVAHAGHVPPTQEPTVDLDLTAMDPLWIVVAAGVLLLVVLAIVVALVRRRRRRARYADRYGPEYQRTVEEAGSRRAADRELRERDERREEFELRSLAQYDRDRFRARWEDLQASFVDGPAAAVRSADELIDDVSSKVGYPKAGREQRLADLSVDHPASVDEYRSSRATSQDAERGPTTEQLRQALLGSRALFEAVVGRDVDVGLPSAPFRDHEEPVGDERSNGHGERASRSADDAEDAPGRAGTTDDADRARSDNGAPDEIDAHPREHSTGSTPTTDPEGRPLPSGPERG
jgi:hypothetical protein